MNQINCLVKMPNWCKNELLIEGKGGFKELIVKIASDESMFDFQQIEEIPSILNDEGHLIAALNCWGTKWNAVNVKLEQRMPDCLLIKFDTAYTPPIPIVRRLAIEFPNLQFTLDYQEPEHEIAGTYKPTSTT